MVRVASSLPGASATYTLFANRARAGVKQRRPAICCPILALTIARALTKGVASIAFWSIRTNSIACAADSQHWPPSRGYQCFPGALTVANPGGYYHRKSNLTLGNLNGGDIRYFRMDRSLLPQLVPAQCSPGGCVPSTGFRLIPKRGTDHRLDQRFRSESQRSAYVESWSYSASISATINKDM